MERHLSLFNKGYEYYYKAIDISDYEEREQSLSYAYAFLEESIYENPNYWKSHLYCFLSIMKGLDINLYDYYYNSDTFIIYKTTKENWLTSALLSLEKAGELNKKELLEYCNDNHKIQFNDIFKPYQIDVSKFLLLRYLNKERLHEYLLFYNLDTEHPAMFEFGKALLMTLNNDFTNALFNFSNAYNRGYQNNFIAILTEYCINSIGRNTYNIKKFENYKDDEIIKFSIIKNDDEFIGNIPFNIGSQINFGKYKDKEVDMIKFTKSDHDFIKKSIQNIPCFSITNDLYALMDPNEVVMNSELFQFNVFKNFHKKRIKRKEDQLNFAKSEKAKEDYNNQLWSQLDD